MIVRFELIREWLKVVKFEGAASRSLFKTNYIFWFAIILLFIFRYKKRKVYNGRLTIRFVPIIENHIFIRPLLASFSFFCRKSCISKYFEISEQSKNQLG